MASTAVRVVALLALIALIGLAEGHGGVVHQVDGTAQFAKMVATLQAAGNYTTLISLLNTTVYQEALNITSGRDRTLFAPTDAAFAALPANVTALLSNTTFVSEVLQYHQLPKYKNETLLRDIAVLSLPSMQTTHGSNLTFTLSGGLVLVNGITVQYADLLADDNTAIHGIPEVLVPSEPPSMVEDHSSHSGSYDDAEKDKDTSGAAPIVINSLSTSLLAAAVAAVAVLNLA